MTSTSDFTLFASPEADFVEPSEQDTFASFLDATYSDAPAGFASPPLFPLPTYSNAFSTRAAAADDGLSSSSRSSGTGSPFDFEYDYASSSFGTATTAGLTTPEFLLDGPGASCGADLPSLFSFTTTTGAEGLPEPSWSPTDVPLSLSPSLMRLPSPSPATSAEEEPEPRSIAPLPVREPNDGRAQQQVVKDKHTGTRNTRIPPIPLDAPTMSRTYLIPAVTSRKRAPHAITAKLAPSVVAKKARTTKRTLAATAAAIEVGEEGLDPNELPEELLTAIEEKRRSNTLAARKSRMRKAGHLAELQERADKAEQEAAMWKKKCSELEEVVRALRGC